MSEPTKKQISTIADSDLISGSVSGALVHGGGVRRLRVQAAVVHVVVGALEGQSYSSCNSRIGTSNKVQASA